MSITHTGYNPGPKRSYSFHRSKRRFSSTCPSSYVRKTNIVLCLDNSGSMAEKISRHNGHKESKIEATRQAALALCKTKALEGSGDLVGIVSFNQKARVCSNLRNPTHQFLYTAIMNVSPSGLTNLSLGLRASIDLLKSRDQRFIRSIVLLSDGASNISRSSVLPLAREALDHKIFINCIGLGDAFNTKVNYDRQLLEKICEIARGTFVHAQDLPSLKQAFRKLG